ncbi:uncharacterized protein LODBEIA_P49150 [Lodderomyces beijingensis]|uniref:Translation machinery-associated protein 22 n=1 Tax=Lodderomyces beijingensis TaxID=1775926 RepID=A0ABP0ZRA0_9ASCO
MTEVQPRKTTYCGVCTMPPEFCEFGIQLAKCQAWLEDNNLELYTRLYPSADETSGTGTSSDALTEKDIAKKQAREQAKLAKEQARLKAAKITIKRIERNKRKHIISISGLEVLSEVIDVKKLAKSMAAKFATGASVTKNAEGSDEVLVQGDVSDEARAFIESLIAEHEGSGLEDVKVEQVDDKKIKKKADAAAAAAAASGKK